MGIVASLLRRGGNDGTRHSGSLRGAHGATNGWGDGFPDITPPHQSTTAPDYAWLEASQVPQEVLLCDHEERGSRLIPGCDCSEWTRSRIWRLIQQLDDWNDPAIRRGIQHTGRGNQDKALQAAVETAPTNSASATGAVCAAPVGLSSCGVEAPKTRDSNHGNLSRPEH